MTEDSQDTNGPDGGDGNGPAPRRESAPDSSEPGFLSPDRGASGVEREACGITYLPAQDALWRRAPEAYAGRFDVLGIALTCTTNSRDLLALAESIFGDWGHPSKERSEAARLRLFVHDASEVGPDLGAPLYRMQDPCFFIVAGASFGFADRDAGAAVCFLTPQAVAAREYACNAFLEPLGLYLVWRYRPATLHAAAVALPDRDRCILLAGSDGAGKSTLAYACVRSGMRLVSEDTVFAAPPEGPALEVWGSPWRIHLLPDAVRFFPELSGHRPRRRSNGEAKLEIVLPEAYPGAAAPRAEVAGVLALSRANTGISALEPVRDHAIYEALTRFKGDPPIDHAAVQRVVAHLLAGPQAQLAVGSDPMVAAEQVRLWLEKVG